MNIIIEINTGAMTEERMDFNISEIDMGEEKLFSENTMHCYSATRPHPVMIDTEMKFTALNSYDREKMMRMLEFTEIIEEAVGDDPYEIICNGIKDLKSSFGPDGYSFKTEEF